MCHPTNVRVCHDLRRYSGFLSQRSPGGISFADGHSKTHKWNSAATKPPVTCSGTLFKIEAWQGHRSRPVVCQYDKAIWSGLSWAVGEVRQQDLDAGRPIAIRCSSLEKQPVELQMECYAVSYK